MLVPRKLTAAQQSALSDRARSVRERGEIPLPRHGQRACDIRQKFRLRPHPKKHGRLFPRLAADEKRCDDRRIGGRFVHVPGRVRQEIDDVGFDDDLVMLAAKFSRQAFRDGRIVNRGLADAIFLRKGNRVGTKGCLRAMAATMLDESRPALRKAPIGTSLTICCSTEAQKLCRISSSRSGFGALETMVGRRKREIPILFDLEFAALPNRVMARLEACKFRRTWSADRAPTGRSDTGATPPCSCGLRCPGLRGAP